MATADKILLGYGVVSIGATPIGLTRGGSSFVVEREFREIKADGDKGPVAGRIVIDREVAKLTVNALEMFTAADMTKYYPGVSVTPSPAETPAKNTMTSTLTIAGGTVTAGQMRTFNDAGPTLALTDPAAGGYAQAAEAIQLAARPVVA